MTNAKTFGQQSATYAKGRPGYPPELYDWIAKESPGHECVWDVGTGSGQAARSLTQYFNHVHATDMSDDQISAAQPHPKITYQVAPAQTSGLEASSVEAITVATALHWFADESFWTEVQRVSKSAALFCAWTYQLPTSRPDVKSAFLDPVYDLIDPYWAEGNRICMAGYTPRALNCPFKTIDAPAFDAGGLWTAQQLVDFAESWSAHFRARNDGLADELQALSSQFLDNFKGEPIQFSLPISILAAHIP